MAVDTPQIKIDPYQSQVPLVQVPTQTPTPAEPLRGQFGGGRGTPGLAIGDSLLKGILQGHEIKAEKKMKQAQATIAAADKSTDDAYAQYQEALASGGGTEAAQAAYKNYTDTFSRAKEAKAQFVLPEKPQKGQSGGQKKGPKDQVKAGFNNIKDFFEANPHIVPQIALMTMQPKPPGMSQDTRRNEAETKQAEGAVKLQDERLAASKEERQRATEAEGRDALKREVEQSGGVDAVLADKGAKPELKQAANQIKYSALDAQSPEGKLRTGLEQDVLSGQSKNWTPEKKMLAGSLGVVPQAVPQTVTGKNGHQQQVLIDPTTNQPLAGTKPLDLGPPAWASEFYAKRAADHADITKAVKDNPEAYGVTPSADPKAFKAAVDAKVSQLIVDQEFGIRRVSQNTGKTGYETQRDNTILNDVVKAAGLNSKNSPLDSGGATLSYPIDITGKNPVKAGTPVAVGRDYFNQILTTWTTPPAENGGVRSFRQDAPIPGKISAQNPDGKPANVLESERRFMYQWVKNQLVNQKGKAAMTPEQADDYLRNTPMGRPIIDGPMTPAPARGSGRQENAAGNLMTAPPSGPTKMYTVQGVDGPVELTDDEAKKARSNNIPIEEVSAISQ